MFLIGLTGGAATGKSTASGYFKELGVPVIDADEVAKLIVEPGQPAFNEIKATFGQEVIASTGQIVSDLGYSFSLLSFLFDEKSLFSSCLICFFCKHFDRLHKKLS